MNWLQAISLSGHSLPALPLCEPVWRVAARAMRGSRRPPARPGLRSKRP